MTLLQTKDEISSGMRRTASYYRFMANVLSLGQVRRAIDHQLKYIEAKSICILGCGDGLGLEKGLKKFERIRFVDLSEDMLKRAKLRFGDHIEFVLGDESQIDDSDLVYLPFVLNMYTGSSLDPFCRSLWNHMQVGQNLLVTDFNPNAGSMAKAYVRLIYTGFRMLSKTSLITLGDYSIGLQSAGFELQSQRTLNSGLFLLSHYRKSQVKNSH